MGGFYQWSREHPEGAYRELWGLVTDIRNLRCAWRTVATNKGKRTPGIDGVTVNATA
jgi:retron-type reverse transcriptase